MLTSIAMGVAQNVVLGWLFLFSRGQCSMSHCTRKTASTLRVYGNEDEGLRGVAQQREEAGGNAALSD